MIKRIALGFLLCSLTLVLWGKEYVQIKHFSVTGSKESSGLSCEMSFYVENLRDAEVLYLTAYDLEGKVLFEEEYGIERKKERFVVRIQGKEFKFKGEYLRLQVQYPSEYSWKCHQLKLYSRHKNGNYSNIVSARLKLKR
jgi:hypothetical protein